MLGHSQPVTRRGDVRDWSQPRSVAAPAAGDRRARLPRNHGRVAPWRRSRPSSRVDGWHGSWRDRAWSPVRPGRVGVTGLAVAVPHHPTWSSRRRAERASRESPGSALERTPFTSPRAFWQRAQKTPNARKAGARRVASETPELDDFRQRGYASRTRSLSPSVAEACRPPELAWGPGSD